MNTHLEINNTVVKDIGGVANTAIIRMKIIQKHIEAAKDNCILFYVYMLYITRM